jgi:Xaa-Pro aminopeptidase
VVDRADGYRAHSFGYAHGIGLSVEYPQVPPGYETRTPAYDGVFQAEMIICVESYVAADDGREGVKLEDPFLIQDAKCERLASYPFEDVFEAQQLSSEIAGDQT